MTAVQPKVFFGEIPPDRTILQKNWLGRQISWIALSKDSHWAVAEGLGFATMRTIAAVAEAYIPPVQLLFLQTLSLGNAACLYTGHKIVANCDLQSKIGKLFNQVADDYAVHKTWVYVFEATSLKKDITTRSAFAQFLNAPLALSKDILSAYLQVSQIASSEIDFNEIWFSHLMERTPFLEVDLNNFIKEYRLASRSTQISRDAWAFAISVEEAALLMRSDATCSLSKCIDAPLFPQLLDEGLEIDSLRFYSIYLKCVPAYLQKHYPQLDEKLKSLIEAASHECSGQRRFLAADALILPHHDEMSEEDQLAYLYHLAFTNEIEPLFDTEGGFEIIPRKNDLTSLSDVLKAFNTLHPLQLFFEHTELKSALEFIEMIELQKLVKENYMICADLHQEDVYVIPALLEKYIQIPKDKKELSPLTLVFVASIVNDMTTEVAEEIPPVRKATDPDSDWVTVEKEEIDTEKEKKE